MPQIIHTDGEDLVVLKRGEYEALLARSGDDAAENAATARVVDTALARIERGEDAVLPGEVWDAIQSGENPLRAVRKLRSLTQAQLAEQAGVAQSFIADIEAGKKTGAAGTLKAIAGALRVPLDLLVT